MMEGVFLLCSVECVMFILINYSIISPIIFFRIISAPHILYRSPTLHVVCWVIFHSFCHSAALYLLLILATRHDYHTISR